MSLRIAGMGWVTPLGRGIDFVWDHLVTGTAATAKLISDSISDKTYFAYRVPPDALKDLPPHPRLRRASAISRFAAAAGLDALMQAKSTIGEIDPKRMALVFAVSNGGVIYTKRFYHDVVESGAPSASPLLFPETVFNAPASHLAAILGITGVSYTIVGDGAAGILAIKMARDLLDHELDACLVVGVEEADWLLCDAYHKWRLLKKEPPIELFRDPPRGTILSEGAGAVLLVAGRGEVQIEAIDAGGNFSHRRESSELVCRVLRALTNEDACVVASANGTFVDLAEQKAIELELPAAFVYSPKAALGESVGASAIWQVITGTQALRTKRLPQMSHSSRPEGIRFPTTNEFSSKAAIVLSCGLNQQVAGLRLSI